MKKKPIKKSIKRIRSLYFSNRKEYYRRQKISKALKGRKKSKQTTSKKTGNKEQVTQETDIYRYSLHYLADNKSGSAEFRAEVYTLGKRTNMQQTLKSFMDNKILDYNRGLQTFYKNSFLVGYEESEVGINDVGKAELNKLRFHVEIRA